MNPRLPRSRRLSSIIDAVGKTPLIRLEKVTKTAPSVEVYVKLEYMNPGGSVKDRPALRMMQDAIADGRLTSDKILIDSTSGNTGVAYSLVGAALGYRVQLVMPKNVTKARKDITRAFGTELIFSDPMEGSDGAIRLVRKIVDENPDKYFYPDQYSNPSNPLSHYHGTGVEILDALGDRITHFVTSLGTSGTMMGTTRRLHEHTRPVRCVAVEPDQALHGLEGLKHLGSSIVPPIYDATVPDRLAELGEPGALGPKSKGIFVAAELAPIDDTSADVQANNLYLFGDPRSNAYLKRILPKLPIETKHDEIPVAASPRICSGEA